MKGFWFLFGVLASVLSFGQAKNDTIQVIAQLVSPGTGSKIYIAEYRVIKTIRGSVESNTIHVGYYFYHEFENTPDTALLTLLSNNDSAASAYYTFPNYDPKSGVEQVKLSQLDHTYWESCETGEGPCNPITITRHSINEKCFLIMPCGGTLTDVVLTPSGASDPILSVTTEAYECPPTFELTNVPDGTYTASMLSCSLGGSVEINLQTKNE